MADDIQIDFSYTQENINIDYSYPQGPVGPAGPFNEQLFTHYLSTNSITLCTTDTQGPILSAGQDLFSIFSSVDSDNQTLTFDTNTSELSISNGNSVSLSSLVKTTDFDLYKTDVATATATATALQTLSYTNSSTEITISNGNTISLSAESSYLQSTYNAEIGADPVGANKLVKRDANGYASFGGIKVDHDSAGAVFNSVTLNNNGLRLDGYIDSTNVYTANQIVFGSDSTAAGPSQKNRIISNGQTFTFPAVGGEFLTLSATSVYQTLGPFSGFPDAPGANNLVKRDANGSAAFGSIIIDFEFAGSIVPGLTITEMGIHAEQFAGAKITAFESWCDAAATPLFATSLQGSGNTQFGYYSFSSLNSEASGCTAFGYRAGSGNTTGRENTAIGYYALNAVGAGRFNTAVGTNALRFSTGNSTVAVGVNAGGGGGVTSSRSVFIGNGAGSGATGGENILIGNSASLSANDLSNCIVLGYGAVSGPVQGTLSISCKGLPASTSNLITNTAPIGATGDYLRIWLDGTEYRIPIQKAT